MWEKVPTLSLSVTVSNNVETLQSTRVNVAVDVWLYSSVNETRKASVALSLNNDSTLCGTYE